MPTGARRCAPAAYAWLDSLTAALDGAVRRPAGVALLLDSLVRGYAPLGADPEPLPAWLRRAVAERHPRLADAMAGDWGDVDAELEEALAAVLRGVG